MNRSARFAAAVAVVCHGIPAQECAIWRGRPQLGALTCGRRNTRLGATTPALRCAYLAGHTAQPKVNQL